MRHLATTCGVAFREAFESCGLPTAEGNAYYRISTGGSKVSPRRPSRSSRLLAERETVPGQLALNVNVMSRNDRAAITFAISPMIFDDFQSTVIGVI